MSASRAERNPIQAFGTYLFSYTLIPDRAADPLDGFHCNLQDFGNRRCLCQVLHLSIHLFACEFRAVWSSHMLGSPQHLLGNIWGELEQNIILVEKYIILCEDFLNIFKSQKMNWRLLENWLTQKWLLKDNIWILNGNSQELHFLIGLQFTMSMFLNCGLRTCFDTWINMVLMLTSTKKKQLYVFRCVKCFHLPCNDSVTDLSHWDTVNCTYSCVLPFLASRRKCCLDSLDCELPQTYRFSW